MGEVSRLSSGTSARLEGHIMRMIVVFAVVVASIALGGCFHHSQQVYTEMPPTSVK